MDALSRRQIDALAPGLANWLSPVPEQCALVRLEHRWDCFVDGSTQRRRTADFAPEVSSAPLEELCGEAAHAIEHSGWRCVDFDEEWLRHVFVWGQYTLRIGPARCFLVDAECGALRVDVSDEPAARDDVQVGSHFERLVRALHVDEPLDLTRETLFDVDDLESIHGWRERGSFLLAGDPADRLRVAGFAAPSDGEPWRMHMHEDELERVASVQLRPDRMVLELQTERR